MAATAARRERSGEYIKEGDKYVAEARKAESTGLFKRKPDWETATNAWRNAVKQYQLAGDNAKFKYLDTLKDSAKAHEMIDGGYHTAAQAWEKAGQMLAEMKETADAAECYKKASKDYLLNNNPDAAGKMMMKAAQSIGDSDKDAAISLLNDACTIFEDADRVKLSDETFKKSISLTLKLNRYPDAIEFLKRQNKIYLELGTFDRDLYKNLLTIVVIYFSIDKYSQAEEEFKTWDGMSNWARSDEYEAADGMIQAWRSGSLEEFTAIKKKNVFNYLDNEVTRMARKLELDVDSKPPAVGDEDSKVDLR